VRMSVQARKQNEICGRSH